jgi:hypothetical protein
MYAHQTGNKVPASSAEEKEGSNHTSPSKLKRSSSSSKKRKKARKSVVEAMTFLMDHISNKAPMNEVEDVTRILVPEMTIQRIDTKRCLATVWFGQYWGEKVLYAFIYREGWATRTLAVVSALVFIAGHVVGFLSLLGVLSTNYSLVGGALTLPHAILYGYLPLIVDVLVMLFTRFETFYMIYNIVGMTMCVFILMDDGRSIYVILGFLVSALYIALTDASPSNVRRINTLVGLGFGLLVLISLQACLFLKTIKTTPFR